MIRVERALTMFLLAAAVSACAVLHPHGSTQSTTTTDTAQPSDPVTMPATETDTASTHDTLAQSAPPAEIAAPVSTRVTELLREAADYGASHPDGQHAAIAEAETRRTSEQTPQALVRFALLQSLGEANRQTDLDTSARLLDLLAQPSMETGDADLVPLARLLAHILGERGRLSAQNAELTYKLNQLKAIERQLGDRDGADMPPPAP